jgi:hypothetical protein
MEDLDGDPPALLVMRAEQRGIASATHRRDHGVAISQRLAHPPDQIASQHRSLVSALGE